MIDYKIILADVDNYTHLDKLMGLDESLAYICPTQQHIYLGCPPETFTKLKKEETLTPHYKKYETIEQLYEQEIINILNHEYIHATLTTINPKAYLTLDNIPKQNRQNL